MIIISCTCGKRFQTQDEHAGKRTKCPACGGSLVVPGADAGSPEKSDKPVPPSWWYPNGQPEAPAGSARPGPPTGETRTKIMRPTPASPLRSAEVRPGPDRNGKRLVIASGVGGGALLLLGLMLWMGSPGPALEQAPGGGARGPSARPAKTQAGRPPVDRAPAVDQADPSVPEGPLPPPAPVGASQPRLKLLVPAYFYPAGPGLKQWEQLIEAASRVPVVAIANPASGPGERRNADYGAILGSAARKRVTVVGYVFTDYAHRPLPEVQADVDRWLRLYPEIGGIFFDAQASAAGQADYYVTLRDYVRGKIKGSLVITNPGTVCAEEYGTRLTSVVLCLFTSASGFEEFRLPRWAERHPSGRFGAMPNNVAGAEPMRDLIQVAPSRGFGLIYVTDAQGLNPWDRLPSYWDAEVEAVRKVNAGLTP